MLPFFFLGFTTFFPWKIYSEGRKMNSQSIINKQFLILRVAAEQQFWTKLTVAKTKKSQQTKK